MNMLLASFLLTANLTGGGYVQIHDDHGVKVYKREHTRNIELAAEGDLDAPPDRVEAALLDYSNHTRWVKHLAESRVLDRGPLSLVVYQRLSLPIIEDRDFTLLVTWGQQGDTRWLHFSTANERGPQPRSGVVRVPVNEGGWKLTPTDGGRRTHAVYELKLDLAGSVPSWLGRGRAGKDLPALFDQVNRQAIATTPRP